MSRYSKQNKELVSDLAKNTQAVVFDFDGVFTDNRVLTMQDGSEAVACWRGDGFGLSALHNLGVKVLVLTTESNPVVGVRCNKLGIPCIQNCDDKASILRRELSKLNVPLENVAYLGNDVNDLGCLRIVGLSACVQDSHPEVLVACSFVTHAKGGYGAVREFCDFLVQMKGKAGQK